MSEFDDGIAVLQRSVDGDRASFEASLDDGFRVGGGVNGGYLLAVLGRAVAEITTPDGHPDPLVVSAHYLSASTAGPAQVDTHVVRSGRSQTTVHATLAQEGGPRITALATYADLGGLPDDVRTTAQCPQLPPRSECPPTSAAPADFKKTAPLLDRFDLLVDPACVGWAVGQPSGQGMIQGWFRLHERDLDPLALLFAVDALPPVTFDLGLPGWAPTVELTAHVRARPAPGWAVVRHSTRNLAGGHFEEDCEVWDSAGRLVAQSRQLARAPRVSAS